MQNTAGFRLSPQQSQLWLTQLDDSISFRAQCAILMEGKLDKVALRTAIDKVLARHEALRTSFPRQAGMKLPLQTIGELTASNLPESDLSSLAAEDQKAKLDQAIGEDRATTIDFTRSAPLAGKLFRLSDEKNVLLLTLPSLCADSLSLGSVANEIAHFYEGGVADAGLPAEPLQYADFSEWQNSLLEGDDDDVRAGKAFWTKHASQAPPPVALPLARKIARNTKWRPESVCFTLAPATCTGLEALVKARAATPAEFMKKLAKKRLSVR